MVEESGEGEWAVPGVDRTRPVELSPEVLALRAAIDALVGRDLSGLPGPQVLAETTAVLAEGQRLQTAGLGLLAEVDARGLHHLDGAPTTGRWVQAQGVGADRTQVAVARRLREFPLVADAVQQRRLTLSCAHTLQVVLARLRPHLDRPDGLIDGQPGEPVLRAVLVDGIRMVAAEARGGFASLDDPDLARLVARAEQIAGRPDNQLSRVEAGFLLLASLVEPAQLPGCLGLLTDALLPEQHAARVERGRDRRCLRLVRDPDGSGWHLQGRLDLECGERLYLLLQAELSRDPDAPVDTALAGQLREQGLDPYDPELGSTLSPRSTAERAHDALDRGLARYLASDLGGEHDKAPVHFAVTVCAETLDGQPGALPARTGSGSVLPLARVRRLACDAALVRHVLSLAGKVIAASHTERTLTASERRALRTQTGGRCQGAGCRRSSRDAGTVLHPHHATPWSRCGTTSLADTVLLCEHCHHDVHDGKHPLRLKDGRRLGSDGWLDHDVGRAA